MLLDKLAAHPLVLACVTFGLIGAGIAYSLWKTRGAEEANWPAEARS